MAWGAIIGAGMSLVSGFMGASSASSSNKRARKQAKKQRKFNKKVAKKTNKYNKKRDAVEQANYHAMRDYGHKTSIKNWKRGKQLQRFSYAQQIRQYEKSIDLTAGQLYLNDISASQAVGGEMASVEDMFIEQQFQAESSLTALKETYAEAGLSIKEQQNNLLGIKSNQRLGTASIQNQVNSLMETGSLEKQSALVEGLLEEGKASLGQAGKSRTKRKQATAASLQRSIVGLESELTGKRKQAGIELAKLNSETSLAVTGVGLNIEKINNIIENSENEAEYNSRVMQANMESFINQTERNIDEIVQQKMYSDLNTIASMMLPPQFAGFDPRPTKPPEMEFIKTMKAKAGFVPAPAQQSVWAPLISGIGSAANQLSPVDFTQL
jgi:hypothetical protein